MTLAVDIERIYSRLETLFELGDGPHADRPGLSQTEQRAIDLAADWMREAGLEVSSDSAGNLYGRLAGADPTAGEIWTGSHLDTVPAGGRFDGALGVVAAIDAVGAMASKAEPPRHTIAAVVFRDEEGSRFGRGFFGSRSLLGAIDPAELGSRDADGIALGEALSALSLAAAPRGVYATLPRAFVELHIEQGPVLDRAGHRVGVVDAITGMWGGSVRFTGVAGHAGTTPMRGRRDAVCATADLVLAVNRAAAALPDAVATVGRVVTVPGVSNVIASEATVTLDARAPFASTLTTLRESLVDATHRAAGRHGCAAAIEDEWRQDPVQLSPEVGAALRAAAKATGTTTMTLTSGAGHDAGTLAQAGIPSGMLFVRSLRGGISHHHDEWTAPADALQATEILAAAVSQIDGVRP